MPRERGWTGEMDEARTRCPILSELQTPNVAPWLMPDTTFLPISPVPPFPLVVHRWHVSRFTRHSPFTLRLGQCLFRSGSFREPLYHG